MSGVTIVDVSGRITLGPEAESLRRALLSTFEAGNRCILLNLEKIAYADSSGLGDLVAAYSAITRRGGIFKLLRPSPRVQEVLAITHMDSLFEICDEEQSAVTSFRAG